METFHAVGNRIPVPDGVGRPHLQLRESRLSGLPRPSAGRRRERGPARMARGRQSGRTGPRPTLIAWQRVQPAPVRRLNLITWSSVASVGGILLPDPPS